MTRSFTVMPSSNLLGGVHWHNLVAFRNLDRVVCSNSSAHFCFVGYIKELGFSECEHGAVVRFILENQRGELAEVEFARDPKLTWFRMRIPRYRPRDLAVLFVEQHNDGCEYHRTLADVFVYPQALVTCDHTRVLTRVEKKAKKIAIRQARAFADLPELPFDQWIHLFAYSFTEWDEILDEFEEEDGEESEGMDEERQEAKAKDGTSSVELEDK
ncbi:hypothetical protein ACQY0O_000240 [Thecaphora frezii]